MILSRPIVSFLFFFFALISGAQNRYYAPCESWINPINIEATQKLDQDSISEGYYYFFNDLQVDVRTKTYYVHLAVKVFNSEGVESESKINFNFNPAFQKLKINSIVIHRNGRIIDQTKTAVFAELKREPSFESNVYEGDISVNAILSDIKVNDIIEYKYTLTGDNPIFENKFYYSCYLNSYYDMKRIYLRLRKPEAVKLNFKYYNKQTNPEITSKGETEEYVWDLRNVPGHRAQAGAPSWYQPYNWVEISEYNSWAEVTQWGSGVFKFPASCTVPDSILSKLRDASDEKKIIGALRYVQNQVRYFGIELGENSHRPKPLDKILRDGYGDCKDKSFLLINLFRNLGFNAWPVLVNTTNRIRVRESIPSPLQFDHVITLLQYNGKNIFYDPTRTHQGGSIYNNYIPDYGVGLLLTDTSRGLITVPRNGTSEYRIQETYYIQSDSGNTELEVKSIFLGSDADYARYEYNNTNINDIEKSYKKFYEDQFGKIRQGRHLTYTENKSGNSVQYDEQYFIKNIFKEFNDGDENKLKFSVYAHSIKSDIDNINVAEEHRIDPISLPFPYKKLHEITIFFPSEWNLSPYYKKVSNEYFDFNIKTTYVGKKFKIDYSLVFKKNYVDPKDYEDFKIDLEEVKNCMYYNLNYDTRFDKITAEKEINWLMVMIAILLTILCIISGIYGFRRIKSFGEIDEVPRRFGGWLILPLIGLAFTPVRNLFSLFATNYFDKATWFLYTEPTSPNYIKNYSFIFAFEMCFCILFIFFSLFILYFFFKSNRIVPKLMITYYSLNFIFIMIDGSLAVGFIDSYSTYTYGTYLGKVLIPTAIWIPYFVFSTRVKETFVR